MSTGAHPVWISRTPERSRRDAGTGWAQKGNRGGAWRERPWAPRQDGRGGGAGARGLRLPIHCPSVPGELPVPRHRPLWCEHEAAGAPSRGTQASGSSLPAPLRGRCAEKPARLLLCVRYSPTTLLSGTSGHQVCGVFPTSSNSPHRRSVL